MLIEESTSSTFWLKMQLWNSHLPHLNDHYRSREKNNIIKYNQGILNIVEFKGMKDVEIYCTTDPECVIVKMTGYGIILATCDSFERRYIEVFRTENGRIKLIRDYWNPNDTPKLSFIAKLKVAYSIFRRKLKSRRHLNNLSII